MESKYSKIPGAFLSSVLTFCLSSFQHLSDLHKHRHKSCGCLQKPPCFITSDTWLSACSLQLAPAPHACQKLHQVLPFKGGEEKKILFSSTGLHLIQSAARPLLPWSLCFSYVFLHTPVSAQWAGGVADHGFGCIQS